MPFHDPPRFPQGFRCASRNVGLKPDAKDLSLFGCLVREYGEEMLDLPEPPEGVDGPGALWPRMEAAVGRGDAGFHVLGMGTDPLTFATDLLVAGTFEADLYDDLSALLKKRQRQDILVPLGQHLHREFDRLDLIPLGQG